MAKEKLIPNIDREICAACSVCVITCPFGCLDISRPAFHGDIRVYAQLSRPEKCTGCSLCRKECPIDAITMIPPSC